MAQDFVRQFQYNVNIMPDHNTLSNTRKKLSEILREYPIKWREQAAQVKPPLNEQKLVDIFIEAQDPDYFHHLTTAMGRPFHKFHHLTAAIGRPFHTAIKIWEMVESGVKKEGSRAKKQSKLSHRPFKVVQRVLKIVKGKRKLFHWYQGQGELRESLIVLTHQFRDN